VESAAAHGDMVALLRASGFEIERLVELQAPASAGDHAYYDSVTVAWASRWPAEGIWVARKRGARRRSASPRPRRSGGRAPARPRAPPRPAPPRPRRRPAGG